MKILQVHNRYKITGGEWTVLNQEYNLLKRDHSVEQLIVDNRSDLNSLFSKFKHAFTTHYNRKSKEMVREQIRKSGADIMHVHNFFPLLSPSIFEAASEEGIPAVLTLHNYRLIHPNGYLLHDGKIDERSVKGSAYSCVMDGVYRNSILQTAVVAHMIEYHRKRETWKHMVDRFICLTEFAKDKFIEGGLPPKKLLVKPNFVEDAFKGRTRTDIISQKKSDYLFVGRISEEKGIRTLIDAWKQYDSPAKPALLIIGEGPLKRELQQNTSTHSKIIWLGYLERKQVLKKLSEARALLFPSEWYEGMPMTILEAFSAGTPVISTDIGSQAEIVEHEKTGLVFEAGNKEKLLEGVKRFETSEENRIKWSLNARGEYEKKYTPEINRQMLYSIYQDLLKTMH